MTRPKRRGCQARAAVTARSCTSRPQRRCESHDGLPGPRLAEVRSWPRGRAIAQQKIGNASVAEDHRDVHRCAAVAICDAGVGTGREKPLNLFEVSADHRAVEERVTERTLIVRVADDDFLILHALSRPRLPPAPTPPICKRGSFAELRRGARQEDFATRPFLFNLFQPLAARQPARARPVPWFATSSSAIAPESGNPGRFCSSQKNSPTGLTSRKTC